MDGKLYNTFNNVDNARTNKSFDFNFNTYINQFILKLDDNPNNITSATCGYNGLSVSALSNTYL